MGVIEAIGMLTLILGGAYFLIQYSVNKESTDKGKEDLIRNNNNCQSLISEYNNSIIKGKPLMSSSELKKELHKIINDPEEKIAALDKIEWKRNWEKNYIQGKRNDRKLGYKYEIEIFEIFENNRELSTEELICGIISKFRIDFVKANELLELWGKSKLVERCSWDQGVWRVGAMLTDKSLSLDDSDWTWQKWLNYNGIELKPVSEEYLKFRKDLNL